LKTRLQRGAALIVTTVMLMATVTVLTAAGFLIIPEHYRMTSAIRDSIRGFYLTQAGIGRTVYKVKTETTPTSPEQFQFEGATITINITPHATQQNVYVCTADYTLNNHPNRIEAEIERINPPPAGKVRIIKWEHQ